MPILDSSFIIDLLRGNKEAHKNLADMEAECSPLSTIINVLEFYRGAYLLRRTNQNLEANQEALKIFSSFEARRIRLLSICLAFCKSNFERKIYWRI